MNLFLSLSFAILFLGQVYAQPCPLTEEELTELRRDVLITLGELPNFSKNFIAQFAATYFTNQTFWTNAKVGTFYGGLGILEYFDIVARNNTNNPYIPFPFALITNKVNLPTLEIDPGDGYSHFKQMGSFFFVPDFSTGQLDYLIKTYGHTFDFFVQFQPCSNIIDHYYTIDKNDEVIWVSTNLVTQVLPLDFVFFIIDVVVQGAGGYPNEFAGYTDAADLYTYLAFLNAELDTCGTPTIDHQVGCLFRHGLSGTVNPTYHISHTGKREYNPECKDRCVDILATCGTHAHIANGLSPTVETEYFCACDEGYFGDGIACAPKSCTLDAHCQSIQGSLCEEGLCHCRESFVWDDTVGRCDCPPESQMVVKEINQGLPSFECIPVGRCKEVRHCFQPPNQVSCPFLGNLASPQWGHCVCNQGYEGGWEAPCVCPEGKTEINGPTPGTKICV